MSGRAFAAVALVGFLLGAMALVLAAVLDSALLAVAGALCVLAVGVAREGWLWRGDLRGWLMTMGGLAALILVAYALSANV